MPNTDQIASRLFKKSLNVGETTTARQFFEEPFEARKAIMPSQIWKEGNQIPATAPVLGDGDISGVVQRIIDLSLTAVPGTTNAFQSPTLIDSIPFNFGDGTYNYVIKDNLDNPIQFGQGDWVVDNDGGILTFYGGVPSNMPPKISFYKYVGDKGIGEDDYIPEATTIYYNTGAAASGNGSLLKPFNNWPDVKADIEVKAGANPGEVIKVIVTTSPASVVLDLSGLSIAERVMVAGRGMNATKFSGLNVTNSDSLRHLSLVDMTIIGSSSLIADATGAVFGSEFFNFFNCKFESDVIITGVGYGFMDNCDMNGNDIVITNTALWNMNNVWSSGASAGYIDVDRVSASPESTLIDAGFGCHAIISNSNINSNIRPFATDNIATVDIIASKIGATGASFTNYSNASVRSYASTFLPNCNLTDGTFEVYNSTVLGTISSGSVVVMTPASQFQNDSSVTGTTIADALDYLLSQSSASTSWVETNTALRALSVYVDGGDIIVFNSDAATIPSKGYKFDAADTNADDGDEYIIPDNITRPDPGSWVKKFTIFEKLDQIVLGEPPAGKNWSDGAIAFTPATLGNEAIYELNVLLAKLSPAIPDDITLSSPIPPAGAYLANVSGGGATVTCSDDTQLSVTFEAFYDPRTGTLAAHIDTVSEGFIVLTAGDDTGGNGALAIVSNPDAYEGESGKEGFYEVINASITPAAPLSVASHTYVLDLDTAQSISYTFEVDDPIAATINNISINTGGLTTQYVSGVPSVVGAESLLVTFRLNDAIRTHYNPTRLAAINAVGIVNADYSPAVLGGEPYSVGLNPIFTDVAVTLDTAYSEDIYLAIIGYNSKDDAGATANFSTNIRIDMISNESARVVSGSGQYPAAGYGGVFDSTQSLKTVYTEELQMLNGKYQIPTGNYLGNQPTSGEDYSSGMGAAVRWVTFQPNVLTNNTGLTLDLLAAEDFAGAVTPGVQIYVKVEGQTGWIDANAAYPGVGDPSADGDPAMVFAQSDGDTKRVTFGAAPRTGNLLVRIGLPTGSIKKFAGIAVSNIT